MKIYENDENFRCVSPKVLTKICVRLEQMCAAAWTIFSEKTSIHSFSKNVRELKKSVWRFPAKIFATMKIFTETFATKNIFAKMKFSDRRNRRNFAFRNKGKISILPPNVIWITFLRNFELARLCWPLLWHNNHFLFILWWKSGCLDALLKFTCFCS